MGKVNWGSRLTSTISDLPKPEISGALGYIGVLWSSYCVHCLSQRVLLSSTGFPLSSAFCLNCSDSDTPINSLCPCRFIPFCLFSIFLMGSLEREKVIYVINLTSLTWIDNEPVWRKQLTREKFPMDWMYPPHPPSLYVRTPIPNVMMFGDGGLWEGTRSWGCPYNRRHKRPCCLSLSALCCVRIQGVDSRVQTGNEDLTRPQISQHLVLGFLASRTVRTQCLVFKLPWKWHSLTTAQGN